MLATSHAPQANTALHIHSYNHHRTQRESTTDRCWKVAEYLVADMSMNGGSLPVGVVLETSRVQDRVES